jgi:hypothetical protein
MKGEISTIEQVYAPIFEYSLLQEIEKRSVLVTAAAGQSLMKTGQAHHRGFDDPERYR